jgi:hypothetical protein
MNLEELKERGIQLLSLVPIALFIAALTCPATDLEPPWGDGGRPPSGDPPDGDEPAADDDAVPDDEALDGGDPADAPPPGPPALASVRCFAPEISAGGVCLVLGSRSASVRWRLDRTALARVECTSTRGPLVADSSAAGTDHRLVLSPIAPAVPYSCVVHAANDDGEVPVASFGLETADAGPWVAITEVLENPRGPEPTQEFVEVANLDDVPVDLSGWQIADESAGAPVPDGTVLAPGDVGLFVADDYDPEGAGDPAAAPDCLLVRMGRSLGSMGLRNSGESVFLLDPTGVTVSSYPNVRGALPDGVSAVRDPPESPEADDGAWGESGAGGPTPGWVGE